MVVGAQEAILDEQEENLRHWYEVMFCHAVETRVKGSDNVVEENLDIAWLVDRHKFHKLGELRLWECSDVNFFIS